MVIILGLGYTGQRLARRLLQSGVAVWAAVRGVERFRDLAGLTLCEFGGVCMLPKHATLVDLIPPLPEPENSVLRTMIRDAEPARVVYISSTGVYGEQIDVDEKTAARPNDERGQRRMEEENWISAGPWTSLILRAAAIYGPGRGVHAAVREGRIPRGIGSGVVSRIHVDDLAAMIQAGISSDLQGAWPMADDDPCSSEEITTWCARLFNMGKPRFDGGQALTGAPTRGRRVNGSGIRGKLGIELTYPSWKTGVPASLEEERLER
jgi:nucleoside-diphosphate-sugar epimerase